jgi:hypothetical protein
MKKLTCVALAFAALAMAAVWSPDPAAAADGRSGFRGPGHQDRLHSVPPKVYPPPRFHNRFQGQHFGNKPYGQFGWGGGYYGGVYASPGIVYSEPAYAPPPPVYVPTPVYVPSPPAYPPPASSVPTPGETVIEFPNGRYELRGDGITAPHRWVWVPNPPTAPPSNGTSPSAPRAAPEPTPRIDVFRWTDENGVVHLTDRLDKVPEAYRAKVTKSQS